MSTPYEVVGRTRQKQRTRAALLAGARNCIADGETPTVDAAAARAGISRTTAYRYFPNQRALLAAAHPETVTTSFLPADAPDDPAERLDIVLRAMIAMIVDTEAQQRTMLRLSLSEQPVDSGSLPLRQGRAITWIGEALEPLRAQLGAAAVDRLVRAIRSATGIESLVWLVDVAGLTREEAGNLMLWTARSLLRAALVEPPPTGRRKVKSRPRP